MIDEKINNITNDIINIFSNNNTTITKKECNEIVDLIFETLFNKQLKKSSFEEIYSSLNKKNNNYLTKEELQPIIYSLSVYFDVNFINSTCNYLNKQYKLLISQDQNKINHPIYKNYLNIISRNNYIKPEIAQCIYLNSYECIAILKTFWIRLIQRTWKKVYKERQNIINKKFQLSAIRNREINYNFIRYPTFPSLKGMMYYLKK